MRSERPPGPPSPSPILFTRLDVQRPATSEQHHDDAKTEGGGTRGNVSNDGETRKLDTLLAPG